MRIWRLQNPLGRAAHEQRTEAAQVTAQDVDDVAYWCGGDVVEEFGGDESVIAYGINVPHISGNFRVSEPDWIVKDQRGRFYKMLDVHFRETYEEV